MGRVLRMLRRPLKLTQAEFGRIVGLTGPGVSKIESGDRDTSTKVLFAWMDATGHSLVVESDDDKTTVDVSHLDERNRELVAALAQRIGDLDPMNHRLLEAQIDVLRATVPSGNSNGCHGDVKAARKKSG